MKSFLFVTLYLFAAWDPVNCQEVNGPLEPWLKGVIAVAVFLVLAMIAFIVNKLWCQDKKYSKEKNKQVSFMKENPNDFIISNGVEGTDSATAADFRCEEGSHVYQNRVEFECDTITEHHTGNHVNVEFQCGTMTECHTENHVDSFTTNM